MQRPGFWDDQEAAARTSAAHARAQRKLKTFRELEAEAGDLDELAEMAAEDEEMAGELATQLASVERRLGASSKRRDCSAASTTPATRSSPSTPAPAAPIPRTGRRCCCACTCAGPRAAVSRSR